MLPDVLALAFLKFEFMNNFTKIGKRQKNSSGHNFPLTLIGYGMSTLKGVCVRLLMIDRGSKTYIAIMAYVSSFREIYKITELIELYSLYLVDKGKPEVTV
jgi:hypothetical protein